MSGFSMKRYYPAGQDHEIDPVCEMKVELQNPPFKTSHMGKTYYFCSEACKNLFQRYPEKYVKPETE